MEVIAQERAWYRGQRIWPGARVTLRNHDGPCPTWARPVETLEEKPAPTPPPVESKPKKPRRKKTAPAPAPSVFDDQTT